MIPEYGDVTVRVALRLERPLEVDDMLEAAEQTDDLLLRFKTEDYREAMLAAGYDGLIIDDAPGGGWIIAYHTSHVRVVED